MLFWNTNNLFIWRLLFILNSRSFILSSLFLNLKPLWQDTVVYFVHWLYNHYTRHVLQEIMSYLWNDGVKERILYYELWVTSVVFNFQRERAVAGIKKRSCSRYGERQRWGKIHCGEKPKMDWRVSCDTLLLRGGCHHATKTRKPRSWRIL